MRAGRAVAILLLLQQRGRMTTEELAEELEVSTRTILRDIEALNGVGVPVSPIRAPGGGYELLDGYDRPLPDPSFWESSPRPPDHFRRATIRLSPQGQRLMAVLGRPSGLRRHPGVDVPGRPDWIEATVRIESLDLAVGELLALGAEVEVVGPAELRTRLQATVTELTELYDQGGITAG